MKKILITGANGFVGASLVRDFVKNYEVDIIVRKNNIWRISDIISDVKNVFNADISDRALVHQIIQKSQPELLLHLSTFGGTVGQLDHTKLIETNLRGTINLLDACVSLGVKRFINTGSSSEYGIKNCPMKESDICHPDNLYGITKLAATNYCSMIGSQKGYDVCTLRLFSPYGPMEDPSRLYPTIINALENNESPSLSNPAYVRDFISINKVIQIYKFFCEGVFSQGDIYNVASGKQQTIEAFYGYIAKQMGQSHLKPCWTYSKGRGNEPLFWEADVSKLKKFLSVNHFTLDLCEN